MSEHETNQTSRHTAGAFDIRTFIALLMGIYGVVLVLAGIFGGNTTTNGQRVSGGINLWVGFSLLVFAGLMQGWAIWRPTIVDDAAVAHDRAAQEDEPPAR